MNLHGAYSKSLCLDERKLDRQETAAIFSGTYERSRVLQWLYISLIRFALFIKILNMVIRTHRECD